jgi:AcrR family transcriptional regulator
MVRIVKKADVRKAEIIQAARSLFQTKDFDNTTMQDVMEVLGIAKGTIYHYFKSKEELLEAVIVDMGDESIERMQAVIQDAQGNALEKFKYLIQAGNISAENDAILEHLHSSGNRDMHVRLLADALLKQAPLYAKLIQQGIDEGIFQTDAPLECAEFILSAIQFMTDEGIYPWSQEDLLRRVQAIPSLIEAQLQAPAGSFQFIFNGA